MLGSGKGYKDTTWIPIGQAHHTPSFMGCRNRRLILFCIFLINLLRSSLLVESQTFCIDNGGNYTANSLYQTNLNSLLSSIPSNIGIGGFFNGTTGQGSDRVFSTALCRADTQLVDYRNCIGNATRDVLNGCPFRRQAILWTEFCTIRFSNGSISGVMTDNPRGFVFNLGNVSTSNIQQFISDLRQLLDNLRGQASAGGLLMKAAAGSRNGPDFVTIYALVQCTPDISASDCDSCLINAAGQLPAYGAAGYRVLFPSCTLRYETTPFFNLSRIQEVEALLAPPPSPPPLLPSSPPPPVRRLSTAIIILIVLAAVSGCIILPACAFIIFKRKQLKNQKKRPRETTTNDDVDEGEISTVESLQYDFDKIRAATDDFSEANELGRGGFGAVYKGRLENGKEIAVKRLSKVSSQGDSEFKNEVLLMARLQHRNLLKIFGFAMQGEERLLIYEFLQNLSLDHFIFDPIKRSLLDWDRRYKIIGGIARGLLYLHEDSRFRIIHRDLKASNVLLDSQMNPKIADFGLARLFVFDETEGNTSKIVGTHGYMAPEYAYRGQISVKIDVFSFGVVILEIISGQKNSSFRNGDRVEVEDMLSSAWRNWQDGTAESMIDPVLRGRSESLRDMLRCIHIALLCVQDDVADRPTMASVVLMLNSSSITMPLPSRPAFFVPRSSEFSRRYTENGEFTDTEPLVQSSRIDGSITDFHPR